MKTIIFTFVILLTLVACNNSGRPGLQDKELLALETPENPDTRQNINFSDSIPSGVKYTEERGVDAAAPPEILVLHSQNLETKNFNPADYYSKVSYVKIKHPLAESGGKFAGTQGISFGSTKMITPLVKFSDKYIFVNDFRLGLFCYDAQGNFLDTIVGSSYLKNNSNEPSSKNKTGGIWGMTLENEEKVKIYIADITGYLGEFSVVGDDCLFLTREGEVHMMNFYNIPTKTRSADIERDVQKLNFQNISTVTVPSKRPFRGGTPVFLNKSTYVIQALSPESMRENFLSSFGIWGDTLCLFQDYVPKVKIQTAYYSGADLEFSYILNNQYTIHQQYCDTVFRLTADNRLKPVYILDFGEKRMDKRTGLVGDKSGKLTLRQWEESPQFIYIVFVEYIDDRNIHLNYRLYHKKDRKLYKIPAEDTYPENIIIENPLPNGLPFTLDKINIFNNILYVVYSKTSLQKLMEKETFSALPEAQKARVKQHYDTLNEDEMLIMKME
jgi:hypothetical protein